MKENLNKGTTLLRIDRYNMLYDSSTMVCRVTENFIFVMDNERSTSKWSRKTGKQPSHGRYDSNRIDIVAVEKYLKDNNLTTWDGGYKVKNRPEIKASDYCKGWHFDWGKFCKDFGINVIDLTETQV